MFSIDCCDGMRRKTPKDRNDLNRPPLFSKGNVAHHIPSADVHDFRSKDALTKVSQVDKPGSIGEIPNTDSILYPSCPIKSANDQWEYSLFHLKNGLRVLAISAPQTEKAAVALSVGVGYFQDPLEFPGVAHFCEHLLAGPYESFIQENGGEANAFTQGDTTTYYFDILAVKEDAQGIAVPMLPIALRHFSEPFGQRPRTTATGEEFVGPYQFASDEDLVRERTDVISEHEKNLFCDTWRLDQLGRHLADERSVYHKFGTGSKDTLPRLEPGSRSKKRALLMQAMQTFCKVCYSPEIMQLVVMGRESIADLQQLVVQTFGPMQPTTGVLSDPSAKPDVQGIDGALRSRPRALGELLPSDEDSAMKDVRTTKCNSFLRTDLVAFLDQIGIPPYKPSDGRKTILVKPVKDGKRLLRLLWLVPDQTAYFLSKPDDFLAHLLESEREGSIAACVKKLGWADCVSATTEDCSPGYQQFAVSFNLTEKGVYHVDELIKIVYAELNLVRENGINEWLFDELRKIGKLEFRFADPQQPSAYVMRLISVLRWLPTDQGEHTLDWHLFHRFEPARVRALLELLTPERMRVVLVSSELWDVQGAQTEPIYGTQFRLVDTAEDLIAVCGKLLDGGEAPRWMDLLLPKPNQFIASEQDLSVLPFEEQDRTVGMDVPELLVNEVADRIWFYRERQFLLPKALTMVRLHSPLIHESAETAILCELFVALVSDSLSESVYEAAVAGLTSGLRCGDRALQLEIFGFDAKEHMLLELYSSQIRDFVVNPKRFDDVREQMLRGAKDFYCSSPMSLACRYTEWLLLYPTFTIKEMSVALKEASPDGLHRFVHERLIPSFSFEWFFFGNIKRAISIQMAARFRSCLSQAKGRLGDYAGSQCLDIRALHNDGKPYGLLVEQPVLVGKNVGVRVTYQIGHESDVPTACRAELFAKICHDAFFKELRSLGYIVAAFPTISSGVVNVVLIVQSEKLGASSLHGRIEDFLIRFRRDYLGNSDGADQRTTTARMSDEVFESYKNSLVALKRIKDTSWEERADRLNTEIISGRYDFQRLACEADELAKLSRADIVEFCDKYIMWSSPKSPRSQVAVAVVYMTNSIPETKPLRRTLSHWKVFCAEELKFSASDERVVSAEDAVSEFRRKADNKMLYEPIKSVVMFKV